MEYPEFRDRLLAALVFPGGFFALIWLVDGVEAACRVLPAAFCFSLVWLVLIVLQIVWGRFVHTDLGCTLRRICRFLQIALVGAFYLAVAAAVIATLVLLMTEGNDSRPAETGSHHLSSRAASQVVVHDGQRAVIGDLVFDLN